jgi:hypothetical protein
MEKNPEIPAVDLSGFEKMKMERFHDLQNQRSQILDFYTREIARLEKERDENLKINWESMQSLGLKQEELPPPPTNPEDRKRIELGLTRKLENFEIKAILETVMEHGQRYPSSFLLGHLKISYADLKRFVLSHPDFISFEGINRWRTYTRI